jgi:hypothetical protein
MRLCNVICTVTTKEWQNQTRTKIPLQSLCGRKCDNMEKVKKIECWVSGGKCGNIIAKKSLKNGKKVKK